MAYAITAYKCQEETLEEVIIDFSHESGIMRNIQTGSFYVALTRVKQGKDVYLKSFSENYITVNEKVEEKITAMRKFKPYRFKKTYVSDCIFEQNACEVKIGYFNMEGFMESNHSEYLDSDLNLLNLDFLILSETWLTVNIENKAVMRKLTNWKIIKRLDATDYGKHMGLMLIIPKDKSDILNIISDMDYVEGYTEGNATLLYQGLTVNLRKYYQKLVFLYIRKTPTQSENVQIAERFSQFDAIIGDLNLNPSLPEQRNKLDRICGKNKYLALKEITTLNHNQLDHIILDKSLSTHSFVTSYHNFSSYHKSIVLRLATNQGSFKKDFLEGIHFDKDNHMKPSVNPQAGKKREVNKSQDTVYSNKYPEMREPFPEPNISSSIDLVLLRFENPPRKNLCFSNVVVTCLLNIPSLRKYFQGKKSVIEDPRTIIAELSNLSRHLKSSKKSTQKVRTIVKKKCFKEGQATRNFNELNLV